jgi:hypothetical protein
VGTILDDLDDHEGYALRRLPDGTLTGTWTHATREFTAYVAGCDCGWRGTGEYPPSEEGWELAVEAWRWEHAEPELGRQAEWRRGELARVLEWLGTQAQADRLEDPATVQRVARGVDRARGLVTDMQRELERQAPEREADDER